MFVRRFLEQKKIVDVNAMERELAMICVRYLCSTGYISLSDVNRVRELASQGYYSFLDYSVIHWTDHLRASVSRDAAAIGEVQLLVSDLQVFLDMYYKELNPLGENDRENSGLPDDILIRRDFQILEYESAVFAKIVHLARLRINIQRRSRNTEVSSGTLGSTSLGAVVAAVRHVIEDLCAASNAENISPSDALAKYYVARYFKCSQENCDYFSEGFPTPRLRGEHERKHFLPDFVCPEPGCNEVMISSASLKAHRAACHDRPRQTLQEQSKREFPRIGRIINTDLEPERGHVGPDSTPSATRTSTSFGFDYTTLPPFHPDPPLYTPPSDPPIPMHPDPWARPPDPPRD